MKQVIIGIAVYLGMFQVKSQPLTAIKTNISIGITTAKTTSLVFPQTIRYVDRGSNDVLVQQVKDAQNILMIKAGRRRFIETNLSVITSGGKVYSLTVNYDSTPSAFIFYLRPDTLSILNEEVAFKDEGLKHETIASYASSILDNKRSTYGIKNKAGGVNATLEGIFVRDDVLFFSLLIENKSSIGYDIDFIRITIDDKKQARRTARQEEDLQPILTKGDNRLVRSHDKSALVLALRKFAIPNSKLLSIHLMEKNGGRHLWLRVNNWKLLQARSLTEAK
jgi:conjugative transposon TraN protein